MENLFDHLFMLLFIVLAREEGFDVHFWRIRPVLFPV